MKFSLMEEKIRRLWNTKAIPNVVCLGGDGNPADSHLIRVFKGKAFDDVDLFDRVISEHSPFRDFSDESLSYYVSSYYLLAFNILGKGEKSWCNSILWLFFFFSGPRVSCICDEEIEIAKSVCEIILEFPEIFAMIYDEIGNSALESLF